MSASYERVGGTEVLGWLLLGSSLTLVIIIITDSSPLNALNSTGSSYHDHDHRRHPPHRLAWLFFRPIPHFGEWMIKLVHQNLFKKLNWTIKKKIITLTLHQMWLLLPRLSSSSIVVFSEKSWHSLDQYHCVRFTLMSPHFRKNVSLIQIFAS